MLGWIEEDAEGRSVLMRSGTGRVQAILPVVSSEEGLDPNVHTVVIEVDPVPGRARSIRLSVKGRVRDMEDLHREALAALADEHRRAWSIAWYRHSWIPDAVLITSLDLQSDTQAWLLSLEHVSSMAPDSADLQSAGGLDHE